MEKCIISPDRNNLNECFPIESYDEVLKWTPTTNWSKLVKPLKDRTTFCLEKYPACREINHKFNSLPVPKTLVCHDMKGGYGNDRFVDGHNNLDDYKFVNWANIDVFVYFSHKFLTIPPLSWINAAHLHGVKILGTVITEGNQGFSDWSEICSNERLTRKLAMNMALICQHYGFDGYLLNIENDLNIKDVKGTFTQFMVTLKKALKSKNPHNLLIWYDAVTSLGQLKWQNCLNDNNRHFFELCDGIFLNYGWNEKCLEASASFAGDRTFDVYVGLDVFGRNFYGGGGFSTNKALELVRKHNLSAAIFAPGWVHENCDKNENPDCRDFKFWSLISQYLYTYGPSVLPFETSFCRGYGHKFYNEGLVVNDKPWFNQSKINYLPALLGGIHDLVEDSCFVYYDQDGFCGGGCLLITQKLKKKEDVEHVDCLLICDFLSKPGCKICFETYVKPLSKNGKCEMDLVVVTGGTNKLDEICNRNYKKISISQSEESNVNGWYRSKFSLDIGEEHVLSISCQLTGECMPLLLGSLKVYLD